MPAFLQPCSTVPADSNRGRALACLRVRSTKVDDFLLLEIILILLIGVNTRQMQTMRLYGPSAPDACPITVFSNSIKGKSLT